MSVKMTRSRRVDLRIDPETHKAAEVEAKKLGISTSRFYELMVRFTTEPDLLDDWMEMLVKFKAVDKEFKKRVAAASRK